MKNSLHWAGIFFVLGFVCAVLGFGIPAIIGTVALFFRMCYFVCLIVSFWFLIIAKK